MIGSDSPTNLAWLINQSNPTSRIDAMESQRREERTAPGADFSSMTINTDLLDRTH